MAIVRMKSVEHLFVICCHLSLLVASNNQNNSTLTVISVGDESLELSFSPEKIDELLMGKSETVYVSSQKVNNPETKTDINDNEDFIELKAKSQDSSIAEIKSEDIIQLAFDTQQNRQSNNSYFVLEGKFLGRTHLNIYARSKAGTIIYENGEQEHDNLAMDQGAPPVRNFTGAVNTQVYVDIPTTDGNNLAGDGWQQLDVQYNVVVTRKNRAIDNIFFVCVIIFVLLANIGMGCKIDMDVVKEVLRRPIAPFIGFCCQFLVMPVLAFGIVMLLKLKGGIALGFLAMGCAPGGGASNMYTYLLNGDVSLSITMTLISTFASLGMIPLWLFTLGQLILDAQDYDINIPYTNILGSLAGIIIPVGIGVLIQYKKPSWSKKIIKLLRPFFLLFIIFLFTFGIYVNQYILRLLTPALILAGCLLPWIGFATGTLVAFCTRQPVNRILSIGIETGIQNSGIPIVLMKFSLPQPEADMSLVSPIVVSIFTPVPLIILILIYEVRRRWCKPKKEFTPVNDEDEHITDPDGGDNSNKIYTGRRAENGEATFEKELKNMASDMGNSEQNSDGRLL